MSSLADLIPGIHGAPQRDREVAGLKAGLEMVDVIKQAVKDRQKLPERDLVLTVDSHRVVLTRQLARRAREKARGTGKPHNEARRVFRKELLRLLAEQVARRVGAELLDRRDVDDIRDELSSSPEIQKHLEEFWPTLSAEQLLTDLFARWPEPVRRLDLVGHSMGGLVLRHACHHAVQTGQPWVGAVRRMVYLGSPHRGAPLAHRVDQLATQLSRWSNSRTWG